MWMQKLHSFLAIFIDLVNNQTFWREIKCRFCEQLKNNLDQNKSLKWKYIHAQIYLL